MKALRLFWPMILPILDDFQPESVMIKIILGFQIIQIVLNPRIIRYYFVDFHFYLSRLFLYSTLLNNKSVASDTSIIGFAMSKGRIFTNPNTAKSIVIIDKMIFVIFIASSPQHLICYSMYSILSNFPKQPDCFQESPRQSGRFLNPGSLRRWKHLYLTHTSESCTGYHKIPFLPHSYGSLRS